MPVRVLVVDDSGFFRRRITEMLKSDPLLQVIDTAANGAEGVEKAMKLRPDVITMDIEMPVMDGITAVRKIMAVHPTPILMFSSLTTEGARATLDALDAGAVDFLPKRFEDISHDPDEAKKLLCARVRAVGQRQHRVVRPAGPLPTKKTHTDVKKTTPAIGPAPAAAPFPVVHSSHLKLVVIGTSTGGPVALQNILSQLPADFPAPILLVQHMPATFTPAFAQRLDQVCSIRVKEAQDGDVPEPGMAYLAPGGKQMVVKKRGATTVIHVVESEPGQNYRPCVDITFASVADACSGTGYSVLALVLTGMGADGREGARALKKCGATVWAQDEGSSVVYGMPAAVAEAGLADKVLPLPEIAMHLKQKM